MQKLDHLCNQTEERLSAPQKEVVMGNPIFALVAFCAVIGLSITVFAYSMWNRKTATALASLGAIILVANLGLTNLGDEAWADYWVGQSATLGDTKPKMAAWGYLPEGLFDSLAAVGTLLIVTAGILAIAQFIRRRREQRDDDIRLEQALAEGSPAIVQTHELRGN